MNHVTIAQALAGRGGQSAAGDPNPDAVLIRLCDQIVEIEDKKQALCEARPTIAEEERTQPALDALYVDGRAAFDRLSDLPDAATLDGARAMARASLALAPKDRDGLIEWVGKSEWLAWSVAEFLAGDAA